MVRDASGKFVKGHEPTGGRKPRKTEERYLDIFRACVSEDDWRDIIARAIQDAKRGDTSARKWLSDYMIGTPVERHEVTGEGGGEIVLRVVYDDKND